MEIFEHIMQLDDGKCVMPTRPLPVIAYKDTEKFEFPSKPSDQEFLIRYELRLGCNQIVAAKELRDPEYIRLNKHKAAQLIAETLYSEVTKDLHQLLVYTYEKIGDRKLDNMISALLKKLRP
jgi:hypothetical protein